MAGSQTSKVFHLEDWRPVHSAKIHITPSGHLSFDDGEKYDYHLIRITDQSLKTMVRISIVFIPTEQCNAEFYVNHWGGVDVCRIAADGTILDSGLASNVTVTHGVDDAIEVELDFLNSHETLSLGSSIGPGGQYLGQNRPQFIFRCIDVTPLVEVTSIDPDKVIVFVDVGARGGLPEPLQAVRNRIRPILFEPDPSGAAELRKLFSTDRVSDLPPGEVIEAALFNQPGDRTLFVTRHSGCSSLLAPNEEILKRYKLAPIFDVVGTETVRCLRYDMLHAQGAVPAPDVIKIDVQGVEYEVLDGFGDLLHTCMGIELETHTYPIYKNQKLMGDLVDFLDKFQFSLRTLHQHMSFDGDAVEFNAYFTKRLTPQHSEVDMEKLSLIERVWGLATSDSGLQLARSVGVSIE